MILVSFLLISFFNRTTCIRNYLFSTNDNIKQEFPTFLSNENRDLVYLDTAASSLKPLMVIDAMKDFMINDYANVHRGQFSLANRATDAFEDSRKTVASFINVPSDSLIFTSGTTDSINIVAEWIKSETLPGDVIIVSEAEHHSNLLPWRRIAAERSGRIYSAPVTGPDGCINEGALLAFLATSINPVRIVALSLVSNVLGCELRDVREIIRTAHEVGAKVLLDAAQAVTFTKIDISTPLSNFYGLDFLAFSSHKMYGPTGIGALYSPHLSNYHPFKVGGSMTINVPLHDVTGFGLADVPWRHEAGTPPITEAIGFAAAVKFIEGRAGGVANLRKHAMALREFAIRDLKLLDPLSQNLRILGDGVAGIVSIQLRTVHANDVSEYLNQVEGLSLRGGFQCAQPLHEALASNREDEINWWIGGSVRASFGVYSTFEDVSKFVQGVKRAMDYFGLNKV